MKIAIGSDHAGLELKAALSEHLRAQGHDTDDLGAFEDQSVDYPDYAQRVARAVAAGEVDRGLLVCGTGQGMAIAANKIPGVRAAVVADTFSARMAIAHNDARVLCIGQRVVGPGLATDIVDAWMSGAFEGGRHARRVGKIESC